MIFEIERTLEPKDVYMDDFLEIFIEESLDMIEQWEIICHELDENGFSLEQLHALFRLAHNLKGSSKSVHLGNFGNFVHCVENLITDVRDQKVELIPEILAIFQNAHEILKDWVEEIKSDKDHIYDTKEIENLVNQYLANPSQQSNLKKEEKKSDSIPGLTLFDEDPVEKKDDSIPGLTLFEDDENQKAKESKKTSSEEAPKKKKTDSPADQTLKVSSLLLSKVIETVEESIIQRNVLHHAINTKNNELVEELLEKLKLELNRIQTNTLKLKMQPITLLLQRMKKIIQDLSKKQQKNIKVVIEGDKNVFEKDILDALKDPLMHIVRNAVDHGIETRDERSKTDKEEFATVKLTADNKNNEFILKISDDGRGMDPDVIFNKAVEKGIISKNDVLSDKDKFMLIFMPGFSTAEKITDVSGRGVGMDVVKQSIRSLNGSVSIESKKGSGSTFLITIPSSVNVFDSFVIESEVGNYCVPVQNVEEIIDLSEFKVTKFNDLPTISFKDNIVPILDTRKIVSDPSEIFEENHKQNGKALLIKSSTKYVCFHVDNVLEIISTVCRPPESQVKHNDGILGLTILENGLPGIVLNLPKIAKNYFDYQI